MKNLQVNKVLPVINANFEEVKVSLIETMEKYKGIVVTEDGLKDCKATQKDLAKIRNDIDNKEYTTEGKEYININSLYIGKYTLISTGFNTISFFPNCPKILFAFLIYIDFLSEPIIL